MRKLATLLFFLSLTLFGYSEGIPVDKNGNVITDFTRIKLTKSQQEKLEFSRTLLLTNEQQEILKEIWPFDAVKVFDPYYKDCTCGEYYAIWYKPDELAFLNDLVIEETNIIEAKKSYRTVISKCLVNNATNNVIYIGIKGDFYFNNTPYDLPSLLEELSSIQHQIIVYLPPFKENPFQNQVLANKERLMLKMQQYQLIFL